ncbi:sensor histidine kinase [Halalkalibacter sp. AB-rgal2]|uniref:sensor histidine kinase n=1 Tax=Halalkalibacter sp. AB-rgal2 TaxID=3242695 RepID=UPI00359DFCB4
MLFRYLVYKKSWILFFVILGGVTNLLITFDQGFTISISSIVYLNLIAVVSFCLFFIWRFKRETDYFRKLRKLMDEIDTDWIESLPEPIYRFPDQMVYELLCEVDRFYRRKFTDLRQSYLLENDYLASWIHEVKAPLTVMKMTIDGHRSNELAQKIETNWLRMHLLIDRQLYISRLPTLESDYAVEFVLIESLLKEEVRDLASWCMEKNIGVEVKAEEEQRVLTDRKWCRFIIRQLLTNAIKYSQNGGDIAITIGESDNGRVFVTIKDEGRGIQVHDLPRIFDKGFTGENGRLQNAATGLGLYLAQTVANKLNITLKVSSIYGKGTAVDILFLKENEMESIRRNRL